MADRRLNAERIRGVGVRVLLADMGGSFEGVVISAVLGSSLVFNNFELRGESLG